MSDQTPKFVYLLNAMENASVQENPSKHGYAGHRAKVLDYVEKLERALAKLQAEHEAERDAVVEKLRKADVWLEVASTSGIIDRYDDGSPTPNKIAIDNLRTEIAAISPAAGEKVDTRYKCRTCNEIMGGMQVYGVGWHKNAEGKECGPVDLRMPAAAKETP